MPIERQVKYTQSMLGNGYVPIVSGEFKHNKPGQDIDLLQDDKSAGGAQEKTFFDWSFDSIFKLINTTADNFEPIVTINHYNSALQCTGYAKKNFGGAVTFDGRGNKGFGIDAIKPRDVMGDLAATGGDEVWQHDNAAAVGNWTTGALATRFARNNLGNNTRDANAFFNGTDSLTIDAGQDKWAWCYWGETDYLGTGQMKGHFNAMAGNHNVLFNTQHQTGQTDTNHIELGWCFYYDEQTSFRTGLKIPPIAVAAGVALANVAEYVPTGIMMQTQRRARQTATLTRCIPA